MLFHAHTFYTNQIFKPIYWAATFKLVNSNVSCFCNKSLQIWPTVKQTSARDQHCGLLIAFPDEKYCLFVFPDSTEFDKVSTAIRITAYMLNGHVYCHYNVPNFVSVSQC